MSPSPQPAHPHSSAYAVEGPLLLSRQELTELTGTQQPARQRRWLDQRGWPYQTAFGRDTTPRVARAVFAMRMLGRDPTRAAPGPRFDALDRFGSVQ